MPDTLTAPARSSALPEEGAALAARFRALESCRLESRWRPAVWALFGWIGHRFLRKAPPPHRTPSGRSLLNLGGGVRKLDGWVNADFYRLNLLLPWCRERPDWMLDITLPFECPDDHWDGVLLEHVSEHLLYSENLSMMREVLRTLEPGALVRVSVPSLHWYLDWEKLRGERPKMNRYHSLPEAISNLTQNHAHRSVWDPNLMRELLEGVGFVDIREREFGESSDPDLAADGESHRWESMYVEARKPAA